VTLRITKTEERIEPVTLISRIRATWLSLVDRGANAAPFQTTKEEDMAGKYIQAIILPNGRKIEDLSELYELDLQITGTEKGDELTKYVLAPETAFKADTLEAVKAEKLPEAQFIVGDPIEEAEKAELMPMPANPMDAPVAEETIVVARSFRDELGRKLEALVSAIHSATELETDPRKRKRQAVDASKAFTDWLGGAMDAANGATKDDERSGWDRILDRLRGRTTPITMKMEAMKMDPTEMTNQMKEMVTEALSESVPAAVTAALKAERDAESTRAAEEAEKAEKDALRSELESLKAQLEELKAKKEEKPEETETPDKAAELEALKGDVAGMATKFNEVVSKLAAWENSPQTPSSPADDGATKDDDPNAVFDTM